MAEVLLAVLAVLVFMVAATVLAAWGLWRYVKAKLRWRRQIRVVQLWTAPPGPRREVAYLRRELAEAITSTPQAVAMVKASAGVVGDLPALTRRLERVAVMLDAELRLLASEPDGREVARLLPAARERVDDVTRAARGIRRAASAGLGAQSGADLRALTTDVEREVAAVAAGVQRLLTSTSTG
ncbi:MAG TPA: hypothetical protein VE664_02865 [Actinomycetes bacterium]|nr:hypothetical protein [Actinomycetes bacterium]